MSKLIYFKRYLFLIEKLRSKHSDFNSIQNYFLQRLQDEDFITDFEYSMRTFERDKKEILQLFGISIEYNRKEKNYFINDDDNQDYSVSRIIDAFSIHNALKESDKFSPSIYLEKRKPSGLNHIHDLVYAIQNNYVLKYKHRKFWDENNTEREVKPLAIKEAQQRWYLIAKDNKDEKIKTFGLDRITDLEVLKTTFKKINYNVDEAFQHAFGIETNEAAEKIVLEFTWQQGNYIKAFPLHTSQKTISENDDNLVIELFVHPTNDFIMELLKYGKDVKVIAPNHLKEKLTYRK